MGPCGVERVWRGAAVAFKKREVSPVVSLMNGAAGVERPSKRPRNEGR